MDGQDSEVIEPRDKGAHLIDGTGGGGVLTFNGNPGTSKGTSSGYPQFISD
jgi:hypothetical protein